jgi:hypothetical protein
MRYVVRMDPFVLRLPVIFTRLEGWFAEHSGEPSMNAKSLLETTTVA